MTYVCQHCRNTGGDWIASGGTVCCPRCYKFTPLEKATVREQAKQKNSGGDIGDFFDTVFGWKSK